MARSIRFLLLASALAIGLAACGDDDSPTGDGGNGTAKVVQFNAAWQGDWVLQVLAISCTGEDTLINTNTATVFCDGEDFVFNPFDVPVPCRGTITNTEIDVDCDSVFVSGLCTARLDTDLHVVRSGETLSGTATSRLQVTGCESDTTACVEFTIEGVRVGDGVAACSIVAAPRANVFSVSRIIGRR